MNTHIAVIITVNTQTPLWTHKHPCDHHEPAKLLWSPWLYTMTMWSSHAHTATVIITSTIVTCMLHAWDSISVSDCRRVIKFNYYYYFYRATVITMSTHLLWSSWQHTANMITMSTHIYCDHHEHTQLIWSSWAHTSTVILMSTHS